MGANTESDKGADMESAKKIKERIRMKRDFTERAKSCKIAKVIPYLLKMVDEQPSAMARRQIDLQALALLFTHIRKNMR